MSVAITPNRGSTRRAVLTVVAAATAFTLAAGCSAEHTNNPTSRALTPARTATVIGFDGYARVDTSQYHTYSAYGWTAAQFTTSSGIRCRIYDGPNSFQYYANIECWGQLPGVTPGVNSASVSGNARLAQADLNTLETYTTGTSKHRVDPASYHLVADGQMIVVPGTRGNQNMNNAVCAADPANTLTCEMQNSWGTGKTHGFRLSPQGSRTY